jgi:hypothetical protein
MFNFVDLLYKSYINAGPRLPHVHDLSLVENPSNPRHLCDVCDVTFLKPNPDDITFFKPNPPPPAPKIGRRSQRSPQNYLYKYYTCNDCGYDECLKCYRKSDREKHEHTLTPTGWNRRPDEYNCNTCGRLANGGGCWECEICKKEGKTYVECYVCHSEPTKDEAVLPNILDGINIIVKNNNKTESLIVRPAPAPATLNNTPAGGKRHHTKRKRHHKDNRTRLNHNKIPVL